MKTLLLLILTVSIVLITVCCGCTSNPPDFYESHQNEYINIPDLSTSYVTPYIAGKVITVNVKDNKFDDIYHKLPSELKASSHEEVETVIYLEWGEKLVGTYSVSGGKGYAYTCTITIIDFSENKIVYEKYFRGSDPPDNRSVQGGASYGSMPTKDIVEYIKNLPRR